jgi:hypothetical protein
LFNDSTTYTFDQIREKLQIKPEIAQSSLQAIVKMELLNITHGSLDNGDAIFELNDKFQK